MGGLCRGPNRIVRRVASGLMPFCYTWADRVYFVTIRAYRNQSPFVQDDLNRVVLDALREDEEQQNCVVYTYSLMQFFPPTTHGAVDSPVLTCYNHITQTEVARRLCVSTSMQCPAFPSWDPTVARSRSRRRKRADALHSLWV